MLHHDTIHAELYAAPNAQAGVRIKGRMTASTWVEMVEI